MHDQRISVVVPVYKAAPYVRQAVESALMQPETGEVILIEDASPDDSLRVCEELAAEYDKVRLLRHPNGDNRGAGESRNLGIRESQYDLIAFLDADDYYLPERFHEPLHIMAKTGADGVYEGLGMHFESDEAAKRWKTLNKPPKIPGMGLTVYETIPPDDLFAAMVRGGKGHFGLIGLVVKRAALEDVGMFPAHLRQAQDTALIYKLAATHRLFPGRLDTPVANRRIHENNRVSGVNYAAAYIRRRTVAVWLDVWRWGRNRLTRQQKNTMLKALMGKLYAGLRPKGAVSRITVALRARVHLTGVLLKAPDLAVYWRFWFCYVPNLSFVPGYLNALRRRLRTRPQRS